MGGVEAAAQDDPAFAEKGAAFVTLTQKGRLRGCIGSLRAVESLADSVRGNAVSAAVEMLSADDFYQPAHREIFSAAKALALNHMAVDLVTMDAELNRRSTLPGVGGIEYLIELTQFVPTAANVKDYIRIANGGAHIIHHVLL